MQSSSPRLSLSTWGTLQKYKQYSVQCTVLLVQCTVHCTLQGPGVPELRGPQQHAQLGGVQAALHRRDGGQREKD